MKFRMRTKALALSDASDWSSLDDRLDLYDDATEVRECIELDLEEGLRDTTLSINLASEMHRLGVDVSDDAPCAFHSSRVTQCPRQFYG